MKGVIWILACVVLVGCESRRLETRRVESSRGGVTRELATAVRRALEAKRVEEGRLVQYGVEKQRLVSALMPLDVDWAGLHALAAEDYVTERDPEAAKNLCAALNPEFMAAEAVSRRKKPLLLHTEKRSERQSEQTDRAERQDRKSQNRTKNPKQNIPDGSYYPKQRGIDGKEF